MTGLDDISVRSITLIENGTIIRNPYRFVYDGDFPDGSVELPVYSFLLDTSAGYILVDTGFNEDIHGNINGEAEKRKLGRHGKEFYVQHSLKRMGISPEDIRIVILTHLHYDHSGGLGAFSGSSTQFLVQRSELEEALVSELCYEADYYRSKDLPKGRNWVPITSDTFTLGSSLKLVRMGGHTAGSQMVDLTTVENNRYLILGDFVHMHEEYVTEKTGTAALTNNFPQWRDKLRESRVLTETIGADYLFSHDRRLLGKDGKKFT